MKFNENYYCEYGYDECYNCPNFRININNCRNCDDNSEKVDDELFDIRCQKADDKHKKISEV